MNNHVTILEIDGNRVVLIDSAGSWESLDEIEKMGVEKTKSEIDYVTITNLDKYSHIKWPIIIDEDWYKLTIPCNKTNIIDITVDGETIKHCLNSGRNTEQGYEIWLHGNLAEYFARISECIAQDDLLHFKNLDNKYLHTVSWNEKVEDDFIPTHVKQFFATGEGPYWYHKDDFVNLPYVAYNGPDVDTNINLDEEMSGSFLTTRL